MRSRRLALLLAGTALLATSCAAAGADSAPGPRNDAPARAVHARLISDAPAPPVAAAPIPPVAEPVPAAAVPVAVAAPVAVLPGADLPVVTIRALGDASTMVNDGSPCSNLSAASLGRGELEVSRTGAADTALTVRFTTDGPALGDIEPVVNEITIPVGATAASVWVTPTTGHTPAPVHEHRANPLTLSLAGSDAYDLGGSATAAIVVHVDLDLFACPTLGATPAS